MQSGAGIQGSPASSQGEKSTRKTQANNLVSVSCAQIHQLIQTSDDIMKIGNTPVNMITVIGLVKSVNPTATCNKYLIDDLTGEPIEVQHWLMGNKGDDMPEVNLMVENTYVRVFGSIRTMQGKVHIQAFSIRPLMNLNELTQHRLEVIYQKLALEKAASANDSMMESATGKGAQFGMGGGFQSDMGGGFGQSNMDMDQGGFNSNADDMGFTKRRKTVYDVIKSNREDNGPSYQWIIGQLSKFTPAVVKEEIEWLVMEGHVYTTFDDQHVKATE